MATFSVASAKHSTLVAATADTVTFTNSFTSLEIVNRGTVEIYATTDPLVGPSITVGGDNTDIILPGGSLVTSPKPDKAFAYLISSGTPAYSVRGFNGQG